MHFVTSHAAYIYTDTDKSSRRRRLLNGSIIRLFFFRVFFGGGARGGGKSCLTRLRNIPLSLFFFLGVFFRHANTQSRECVSEHMRGGST